MINVLLVLFFRVGHQMKLVAWTITRNTFMFVAVNGTWLELLGTESIGGIGGYRDLSQLPEHY